MPVIPLQPTKPAPQPTRQNRSATRALRRQSGAAVAVGLVAGTLTALSLSHLAHGIAIVTASPQWESWAMAAGIDLGFIGLELSQLSAATEAVRRQISKFTRPGILGTLAGSAIMNGFAFGNGAVGWMLYPAIVLGIAIPALVYLLTRVAAALYLDCTTRG